MLSCAIIASVLICSPVVESIDFDLRNAPGSKQVHKSGEDSSVNETNDSRGVPFRKDLRASPFYQRAVLFKLLPLKRSYSYEEMSVPTVWQESSQIDIGSGFYVGPLQIGYSSLFNHSPRGVDVVPVKGRDFSQPAFAMCIIWSMRPQSTFSNKGFSAFVLKTLKQPVTKKGVTVVRIIILLLCISGMLLFRVDQNVLENMETMKNYQSSILRFCRYEYSLQKINQVSP